MQAIRTRYIGPGNNRGSRIQAKCEACTIYMPYRYELNIEENHVAARELLVAKMKWDKPYYQPMVCGFFANDGYHVFMEKVTA